MGFQPPALNISTEIQDTWWNVFWKRNMATIILFLIFAQVNGFSILFFLILMSNTAAAIDDNVLTFFFHFSFFVFIVNIDFYIIVFLLFLSSVFITLKTNMDLKLDLYFLYSFSVIQKKRTWEMLSKRSFWR